MRIPLATLALSAVMPLAILWPVATEAQTVAPLTLGLTNPPSDTFSNADPMSPGTFRHRRMFQLVGTGQIPTDAVIQEVRLLRISSGTFSPGVVQASMRPMLSNGVDVLQVPSSTMGDPDPADPLEVYGIDEYVIGGTNVFTSNPFTGQQWTRADLNTLFAGFWARWSNSTGQVQTTQRLSFNDFIVEVVYYSLTLTLSGPNPLNLSTGDNGRFLTTAATPSTTSFSPTFTVGAYSNPNSDCAVNLRACQEITE